MHAPWTCNDLVRDAIIRIYSVICVCPFMVLDCSLGGTDPTIVKYATELLSGRLAEKVDASMILSLNELFRSECNLKAVDTRHRSFLSAPPSDVLRRPARGRR